MSPTAIMAYTMSTPRRSVLVPLVQVTDGTTFHWLSAFWLYRLALLPNRAVN